jgi:hypothetical protein
MMKGENKMLPAKIIAALRKAGGDLPEALQAASEHRETMTPVFLEEIKKCLLPGRKKNPHPEPLIFILLLFGQWREKRAYESIMQLLTAEDLLFEDSEGCETLTGLFDNFLHRVVAATYNGDPKPLFNIMLNRDFDAYTRAVVLNTLPILVWSKQITRPAVAEILVESVPRPSPGDSCETTFEFDCWARLAGMLGLQELRPLVEKVISLEQTCDYTLEDLDQDFARALDDPDTPHPWNNFSIEIDPIEELKAFGYF